MLIFNIDKNPSFSLAPWVHVYTNPIGDVYPCCIAHGKTGNISGKNLDQIVNSVEMKELRTNMIEGKLIDGCKVCYKHEEKIWAVRAKLDDNATQVKDMGYIDLDLATRLDVVFISYHEPDADLHWRRVKSKAPYSKRVNGVDGIFEAHRAAGQIAETDMFYVVDGDAWLVDDWNFDFSPDLFDRRYVYIWVSANPFNDLNYGYGGVKLFPRQAILKMHKWTSLDLSTTIGAGVKVMNKISNVTKFNVDEFSTWRSAFRETVKLCQNNEKKKLASWVSKDSSFKLYAILGIEQGREFFKNIKIICLC